MKQMLGICNMNLISLQQGNDRGSLHSTQVTSCKSKLKIGSGKKVQTKKSLLLAFISKEQLNLNFKLKGKSIQRKTTKNKKFIE